MNPTVTIPAHRTRVAKFIERHQTDVIEKILRHCGLWEESPSRAAPSAKLSVTG